MEPLFLGGHPAVDFLNTSLAPDGQQIETIGEGRAYLAWFVRANLLTQTEAARVRRRFGAGVLDAAAAEARDIREWARAWLTRWRAAPRDDYSGELAVLNKLLARDARRREVIAGDEGPRMIEQLRIENIDALLGLIAAQIATLITQEDPSLLRNCAGPACTLWFLDRTKAHRRLFCSAATCGNRSKVAAFRARQRR